MPQPRRHRFDQRQEGHVEEQHLVFGMVGDVDHLVGMQARVQRVQHRAGPGHAVVQLQVAVAVPGQRADGLAGLDAQRRHRLGHLARAHRQVLVGVAVDIPFHAARDDLLLAMVVLGVHQQVRDQLIAVLFIKVETGLVQLRHGVSNNLQGGARNLVISQEAVQEFQTVTNFSAEFGRDHQWKVEHVESSFQKLIDDLKGDRCDVAMFAVGVTAQRAEKLRFTQPYLRSDIYGITTKSNQVVREWSDIDKPGVLVAVQSGTFMEPVMEQRLKHAQLVRVKLPATRERELVAGRVDVFMTDYPYSRRLLDNADWARLIAPPEPFSVLPYAYAVKPGDAQWLAVVDEFVSRIKKDGRLNNAASKQGLGPIVVR